MIARLQHRGEQGSALVVALAFLSVFGIFIAAILAHVSTSVRLTGTTRERAVGLMAADGGVEWAIQRARTQDAACPNPLAGVQELTGTLDIAGRGVTVMCEALTGAAASPASQNWSVITTSGLVTTAGASPRITGGDVFAGGTLTVGSSPITAAQADVIRGAADCTTFSLTGINVGVPDTSSCQVAATPAAAPDVPHDLPAARPPLRVAPEYVTCVSGADGIIWHPGYYPAGTGPDGATYTYLESGVYYFEDVNLTWSDINVVGGKAPAGESPVLNAGCPTPSRMNDSTLPTSTATGAGVTIILGGSSSILVRGGITKVELYSRVPGGAPEGTPGISIMTVPSTSTTFKPSTAPMSFEVRNTNGRAAIHGLVYSRNVPVKISTQATAPLLGGVVTSLLTITPGAAGPKAVEAIGRRTVLLTSVAAPAAEGEIASVQSAVVKIANDPTRTASVRSWRAQ